MLTAYYNYKEAHYLLQSTPSLSKEERFELCKKTVVNFTVNRSIREELNYYGNTGSILGKHPIFWKHVLKEKVFKMSNSELLKKTKSLDVSIWRDEKTLKKNKVPAKDLQKISERLEKKKLELNFVKEALGVNG